MKKSKNKPSLYEKPLLEVILLAEKDVITTSGWEGEDHEGELTPIYGIDSLDLMIGY